MNRSTTFLLSLGLVVAAATLGCGKSQKTNEKVTPAEERYILSVADADKDGVLSDAELNHYRDLQKQVDESNGELIISEDGELTIADKFAHDEEARAAFEERQHAKDM